MSNVVRPLTAAGLAVLRTVFNPFRFQQRRMVQEGEADDDVLLQASCITVKNLIEVPGIVQATDSCLILKPCIGKPGAVDLDAVRDVEETMWFNGRRRALEFQHGFWVKAPGMWRFGFAVTNPEPWRALFRQRGLLPNT